MYTHGLFIIIPGKKKKRVKEQGIYGALSVMKSFLVPLLQYNP